MQSAALACAASQPRYVYVCAISLTQTHPAHKTHAHLVAGESTLATLALRDDRLKGSINTDPQLVTPRQRYCRGKTHARHTCYSCLASSCLVVSAPLPLQPAAQNHRCATPAAQASCPVPHVTHSCQQTKKHSRHDKRLFTVRTPIPFTFEALINK